MPFELIKYVNAIQANYLGTQKGVLKTVIQGSAQAKTLCTFDTGELRNSIGYSSPLMDGGYNNYPLKKTSTFLNTKGTGLTAYYGTALEYAPYVERGTRRMVAQPFLEPSADILKGAKTAAEVKKELNDEFKKQVVSGTKATRRFSSSDIAGFVNS